MRNFNNWVKSVLLRTYIQPQITVLDLCCGKGGDLLKWKEGCIGYLICADISESSVEACKGRYSSQRMAVRGTRKPPFEAEFYVADCCSVRLRDLYRNSGCSFNIVSCQFSLHYSFESYSRAHMMLRNACENLRPGGYFIGTTVDSNEIV
jgi:mRNA (guanine-N7-)-methyltransferase